MGTTIPNQISRLLSKLEPELAGLIIAYLWLLLIPTDAFSLV